MNGNCTDGIAHTYGFFQRLLVDISTRGIPGYTGSVNLVIEALQEFFRVGTGTAGTNNFCFSSGFNRPGY